MTYSKGMLGKPLVLPKRAPFLSSNLKYVCRQKSKRNVLFHLLQTSSFDCESFQLVTNSSFFLHCDDL